MGGYDWRLSRRNVWAVERLLLRLRHQPIRRSGCACAGCGGATANICKAHGKKPLYYRGRDKWTEIPKSISL